MQATDEVSELLAELELTLGEGPGRDAAEASGPVLASDLGDAGAARRWPLFAAAGALLCALVGVGVVWKMRTVEVAPRNAIVAPPPPAAPPPPVEKPPEKVIEPEKPAEPVKAARHATSKKPAKPAQPEKKRRGGVVDEVPF